MTLTTLKTLTEPHTERPRVRVHTPGQRRRSTSSSVSQPRDATTILVAEDDWDTRQMLVEALQDEGYRVIEVEDGEQLARCLADPTSHSWPSPDLVISDIRMPGHTGLDVLSALRESDWAMPIILITAFGDIETHEEARRLGVAIVLDKPFDMEEMIHAARNVMPATISGSRPPRQSEQ